MEEFVNEDLGQVLFMQEFCFENNFAFANEAGGVDGFAFLEIGREEFAPVGR